MENKISKYYDEYEKRQSKRGIHKRHFLILEWLKYHGLKRNHDVLEVGAGIGTVTRLLAEYLKYGNILANDISQKSIETAKRLLYDFNNVEYEIGDIIDSKSKRIFDVILLPDVLEHIPLEKHSQLFMKLDSMLSDDGFILIHMPNPYYTEWLEKNNPKVLQIIDQPIHMMALAKSIINSQLYFDFFRLYSIWTSKPDYQVIVFRKRMIFDQFNLKPQKKYSLLNRIILKISRFLGIKYFRLPN